MINVQKIPLGEEKSKDFKVLLNGTVSAELYSARVSAVPYNTVWPGCQRPLDQTELASFLSFETDEEVHVRLTACRDFQNIVVRPISENICARKEGRDIFFTIQKPGQYTVELDGFSKALHIFANPVADCCVDPSSPDVIYFAPGIHKPGLIEVKSNQTVYIDSGAVVYGAIQSICAENIKVTGYGILDGSEEVRDSGTLPLPYDFDNELPASEESIRSFLSEHQVLRGCMRFYYCTNVTVSGVICRDLASFAVIPAACDNIIIDNIKTIGMWRYNSDGIDLFNSANCVIKNCFLRNFDDCIVLKGIKGFDKRNLENILVQNCVVWCDWGRALEIGAETCADEYRNIIFEDCDVIHGNDIMLDIQNADRAEVHDVTFENIRCEYNKYQLPVKYQHDMTMPYTFLNHDWQPKLIKIHSFHNDNQYSHDKKLGNIHDITLKNIYVLCDEGIDMPKTVFEGIDENHLTKDIRIDGLFYNGNKIRDITYANIICYEFVRNIIFV